MPTVRYTVINGEVIAEKRNGVRRLYVPDPLGSTVALVDNTQTITDRFSYWPYGEEASGTGTTPTAFRYVGTQGYHRDRLNSIYVRRRHYRPDAGRWLTDDPSGAARAGANGYGYAGQRPVTVSDPSGLRWCTGARFSACWRQCRDAGGVSSCYEYPERGNPDCPGDMPSECACRGLTAPAPGPRPMFPVPCYKWSHWVLCIAHCTIKKALCVFCYIDGGQLHFVCLPVPGLLPVWPPVTPG